jgi:hypothetical protein
VHFFLSPSFPVPSLSAPLPAFPPSLASLLIHLAISKTHSRKRCPEEAYIPFSLLVTIASLDIILTSPAAAPTCQLRPPPLPINPALPPSTAQQPRPPNSRVQQLRYATPGPALCTPAHRYPHSLCRRNRRRLRPCFRRQMWICPTCPPVTASQATFLSIPPPPRRVVHAPLILRQACHPVHPRTTRYQN